MEDIRIGKYRIKRGGRPFIMLETGINHNGELAKAYRMIALAKSCGADAIKFQTFKADEFVADQKQKFTYYSQGKKVTESMLNMFKRYEFSAKNWRMIKERCDKEGILFLSTPQNISDLEILLKLGVKAIKVGSDDLVNIPLLKSYAKTGLPIILSCGMAEVREVLEALSAVGSHKGYPVMLLQCTSQYPTPFKDANLLKIRTLMEKFPQVPIGFSDHTQGTLAASVAVGLGAVIFEKHFTLSHDLPGPDHWFSADPKELKAWIKSIRDAYVLLGNKTIEPTRAELANKREFQRVVVASCNIGKGDKFSFDNLTMKRVPGGRGMRPKDIYFLIGKICTRRYDKGEAIKV